jgi:hypothetical protein
VGTVEFEGEGVAYEAVDVSGGAAPVVAFCLVVELGV